MSEIQWGPEIRVDGKRPEWLADDHQQIAYTRGAGWYGYTMSFFVMDAGNAHPGWASVTAIRLPADHPHYSKAPATPERDPALWDRMEALVRKVATWTWVAHTDADKDYVEARAIVAALPKPIDPDLIEARECVAKVYEGAARPELAAQTREGKQDNRLRVQSALLALQRGRALAAQDAARG